MTSAAGNSARAADGNAIFERRSPLPITTMARSSTARVDEHRPVGGQPDRSDSAVLHARAGRPRRPSVRTRPSGAQPSAHDAVDVGARGRQYDARRVGALSPRRPAITTQLAESSAQHAVARAEGRRVSEVGVDRRSANIAGSRPALASSRRQPRGGATRAASRGIVRCQSTTCRDPRRGSRRHLAAGCASERSDDDRCDRRAASCAPTTRSPWSAPATPRRRQPTTCPRTCRSTAGGSSR